MEASATSHYCVSGLGSTVALAVLFYIVVSHQVEVHWFATGLHIQPFVLDSQEASHQIEIYSQEAFLD